MFKLFRSALMAGITIGVAGFGFLASGVQSEVYGTVVGAILFSFGLLTVLGYKMALYTGTAGFIKKNEVGNLLIILLSNILGCLLLALLSRFSVLDIQAQAQKVLQLRMHSHVREISHLFFWVFLCSLYAASHTVWPTHSFSLRRHLISLVQMCGQ